jgi:hypothetical protein
MAAPFFGEFMSELSGTVPGAPYIDAFAATTSVAGSFSGFGAVPAFTTAAEAILYPNEPETIVATSSVTTVAGAASTTVTLPDGSVMTLLGVAAASLVLFAA